MKVLCIFMVCLLAGAQANFFTDLGNSVKNLFSTLGGAVMHELDTTGVKLLNAGVDAGKTLVSQGVQALALNTANALSASKDTRDLSLLNKVESSLHNMMDTLTNELHSSLQFLSHNLGAIVEEAGHLNFEPAKLNALVDALVGKHNQVADNFLKVVEHSAENIVSHLVPSHKRNAFTEFFAGIGKTIANQFQPMVDGVKNLATTAGTAITYGANALLQGAKNSVAQLGQKLQPHLNALTDSLGTMVSNGANAVSALKQATGDILTQTAQNMQKPLTDIMNTAQNAGATVVNHVAGTLLGSNQDQA